MSVAEKMDPRKKAKEIHPPLPKQQQDVPGTEGQMRPTPDHGEKSYRGSGKLTGQAALITGGDSGIGRAVALAFAREGADVVISYLEEHEDAEQIEKHVREAGRKAIRIAGDISDEGHCRELVERAVGELGRLDILVNNAAFQGVHEKIDEITSEEFDRTYKTNVYAMFYLSKAALPHMKPGSSIINTSSIQAYDPSPTLLAYASTKSAIIGFTKALARMVVKQGVRANAVAPGPVWTPLIPSTFPSDHVQEFGESSIFERPAQPAELAPLFVWLASPEASYVTGEVFGATGGRTPF